MTDFRDLAARVRAFCEARDWDQFHTPKELAIGAVTEAAELLDLFRFLDDDQQRALLADAAQRERVEHELADVLFFLLRFAQLHDVDLAGALERKMALNEQRYPVDLSRGRNAKSQDL
jgi:NTP pyrophosphatase (non-canonical NTP hydrolase)